MIIIQRLPQTLAQVSKWCNPISRKFVTVHTDKQQIDERAKRVFCHTLIVGTVIGLSLPFTAWTAGSVVSSAGETSGGCGSWYWI